MTELERLKRDMDGLRESILKFNNLTLELSKSDCDAIRANITLLIADFDKLLAKVHYEEEIVCYYNNVAYSVGSKVEMAGSTTKTCLKDGTWF